MHPFTIFQVPLLPWSNVPHGGISSDEWLVGLAPRVLFPPQFKLQKRPHYNQELTSYVADIVCGGSPSLKTNTTSLDFGFGPESSRVLPT